MVSRAHGMQYRPSSEGICKLGAWSHQPVCMQVLSDLTLCHACHPEHIRVKGTLKRGAAPARPEQPSQ